ncbi:hypothetical protein DdX_09268 [Ditylenchus destructor]|uniref:Uncharacterized protein n=1 Tax=Ditylenchus destructor TaxID=166010 RepID=A0AAD4R3E7_9BILA|nr:hypothetical protein DdX_09268 [Ditylenchus destructor]
MKPFIGPRGKDSLAIQFIANWALARGPKPKAVPRRSPVVIDRPVVLPASRSLIPHSPHCKSATEPASQPKHVPLNDRNPADNRTWRPALFQKKFRGNADKTTHIPA